MAKETRADSELHMQMCNRLHVGKKVMCRGGRRR